MIMTDLPDETDAASGRVDPLSTLMFREAAEAADAVRRQLGRNAEAAHRLGLALRFFRPRAVVTCARGSSDHAATFAKYLIETRTGVITASAAPSVSSVYGTSQDLRECLFLAISQSGRSPDLLASARAAKAAGATVVALVNAEDSPLAGLADHVLPLAAGEERSVAATKSYLAALAAIVHLVSEWTGDDRLKEALEAAPAELERAWQLDWEPAVRRLKDAQHLYVIARGTGLGIAQEAALKCKETCSLHAEAFSEAEVRHGPQALLRPGFPALLFAQSDAARAGIEDLAADLVQRGVQVFIAGGSVPGATVLPALDGHPTLQPLFLIQSFYRVANALACARGCNPDRPPHLRKVTETR
jgi:glucosamine--fructose-6-phosphate aminotransferase (isomerizing)